MCICAVEMEYSLNMRCKDGIKAGRGLYTLEYCLDMGFKDEIQTDHWLYRWGTHLTWALDIQYCLHMGCRMVQIGHGQ